jgi:hypothetical protein
MNVFPLPTITLDSIRVFGLYVLGVIGIWIVLACVTRLLAFYQRLKQESVLLEVIPPTDTEVPAVSTAQLFTLVYGLLRQRSLADRFLFRQPACSLEIASHKEAGIRYLLRVPKTLAAPMERSLRAYLPALRVKEASEYLPNELPARLKTKVLEFKLAGHSALPLSDQTDLKRHDPLVYLTGNMTQLTSNELLVLQLVVQPVGNRDHKRMRSKAAKLQPSSLAVQRKIDRVAGVVETVVQLLMIPLLLISEFVTGLKPPATARKVTTAKVGSAHKPVEELVKSKLDQPLFETSVRALLIVEPGQMKVRERGLWSAFMTFAHPSGQSLTNKKNWLGGLGQRLRWWQFKNRLDNRQLLLSASEVGALYHFPYAKMTQTEDMVKSKSRELPAPLSLKNNAELDTVFALNRYGNSETNIGLTDDERSRHMYLIGQTGSGKSTAIYHMAKGDIAKGRGLAVVDPHGDLAEDLLATVPESRINDVIYVNPFDIKHPIGINLLELPKDLDEDELELEKELACESVISIFRRVFNKDETTDAHRIEYILRNAIHTAFVVEDATIFTIYELLNNPKFQKQVIPRIKDPNLRNFWKNEFGKAGNYQIVKMVSGVTAKIGRFLFSPTAKRILEQSKSTVNFEDILNSERILLCNLAEGKIGEDTSQLLGTMIIAKIHQAALRRARKEAVTRKPFYLFVDEFQNFATSSFTKLLSGGRKFGLRITIAEQSTAQQSDRSIVDVILANTGVVVCFRTASPVDEELMLAQFSPLVKTGDIANLPRHKFYMRLAAIEAEDPFSGETIPINPARDLEMMSRLIEASRASYAIEYRNPEAAPVLPVMNKSSKPKAQLTLESLTPEVAAADTTLADSTG